MLRIAPIGKHDFAWGLTWVTVPDGSVKEVAKERLDPASKWVYTSRASSDGRLSFGFGTAPSGKTKKLYSYAAALASVAGNGIYVAPIDDDSLWYVVILDGGVVDDTDAIEEATDAIVKIERLRSAFGLPVLLAEGFDAPIEYQSTFDPEAVLVAPRLSPMLRAGGSGNAKQAVVLLVLMGAVGGMGWWMFAPKKPVVVDRSAQQAAAMRQAYLDSIRTELGRIPQNANWVADAVRTSESAFPIVRGGWHLREVTCMPASCNAIYVTGGEGLANSVGYLGQAFESGQLAGASMQEVAATVPLNVALGLTWDDAMIEGGHAFGESLADTLGSLPLRVTNVAPAALPLRDNISQLYNPPLHVMPLYRESVRLASPESVDQNKVRYVAARLAQSGFAPMSVRYTTGSSSTRPAWELEVARITGASQ